MKITSFSFIIAVYLLLITKPVYQQGLPPGWDFINTPTQHIISVQLSVNPNINGYALKPGDWIGVFYINDSGEMACGGAVEWSGVQNTGIMANGNDSFTPEKDGFANGELINYKVYSWSVEKQYDSVVVTCNDNLPSTCLNFVPSGLSGLASFDAFGFYLIVEVSENVICQGESVQLFAIPSGGSGTYTYNWSSTPSGFSSNIADPVFLPVVSTIFQVAVSDGVGSLSNSVYVEVFPSPESSAGTDQTICEGEWLQLSGAVLNADNFQWSASGDGAFSNNSILNPTYSPGTNDILSGSVALCLTAFGEPPCPDAVDCMTLTILPLPIVTLSPFPDYCQGDPPFDLFGGNPPGGIYYINGVAATTFDPSETGFFEVVYYYADVNGCADSATGSIAVYPVPEVICPDDFSVCFNDDPFLLTGALPVNGIYSGPGVNTNIFFPTLAGLGNHLIHYFFSDVNGCSGTCSFFIGVLPLPSVNAGFPVFYITLPNTVVELTDATAVNFDVIEWSTQGDGVFNDPNSINPEYTLGEGDIFAGSVVLTLTGENQCGSVSDNITVIISECQPALVDAGNDSTICEDVSFFIANANALFFESLFWSNNDGDGFFDDSTLLNPVYTPGTNDIFNGMVELTLTAFPLEPCDTVSDSMILSIVRLPDVIAGNDQTICEDEPALLSGSVSDYLFCSWITNGDGFFENPLAPQTVYHPGIHDIGNQQVQLSLHAVPIMPCTGVFFDHLTVSIVNLPSVYAGEDVTISPDETLFLNAVATGFNELSWSTTGDGTFSNGHILNPEYVPGTQDLQNAGATLTLAATALYPCVAVIVDELELTIDTLAAIAINYHHPEIQIFPNPASTEFFIEGSFLSAETVLIHFYDLTGRLIFSKIVEKNRFSDAYRLNVSVEGLPNGLIFLKIEGEKFYFTGKLFIAKH
jgi:hypothetical protein